jgi:anti-anti-sigma factor
VDGAIVLALHGELDLGSAPALEGALSEFERSGSPRLVIDLENLQFMDSTGLALMVRAQQAARESGYRLVCRRGPKQVQRLFELTGVIDRLEFED